MTTLTAKSASHLGGAPSGLAEIVSTTGLGWKELHERLFLNIYSNQVKYKENQYKGSDFDSVKAHWEKTRLWLAKTNKTTTA